MKDFLLYEVMFNKDSSLSSPSSICWFQRYIPLSMHFESQKAIIKSYNKFLNDIILEFDLKEFILYGYQEYKD